MRFCSPEHLRNGVNDWKEITPESLRKAVEALRKKFSESAWKVGEIMRQGCYPALHNGTADQARIINEAVQQLGYPEFPSVDGGQTEPTVFEAYFDRCASLFAKDTRKVFFELYEIASVQQTLLGQDPVEWASSQTKVMIADESYGIPLWTKWACDEMPINTSVNRNEDIYWATWRAPKWFLMQPFANWPYNPETAWERIDEVGSNDLLEAVQARFNQRLVMALENAVDETHIRLAKHSSQVPRVTQTPAPMRASGGLGPKPMRMPMEYPLYYPNALRPKTEVILATAVKRFPDQEQILELCKYVISEMTAVFRAAAEAGTMKPDEVISGAGMGGLLHSLLVYNCDSDNERFLLGQEARKSDEWSKLAKEIAGIPEEQSAKKSRTLATSGQFQSVELYEVDRSLVELGLIDFSLHRLTKLSTEHLLRLLESQKEQLSRLRQANPDWQPGDTRTEADHLMMRTSVAVKQIMSALALRDALPASSKNQSDPREASQARKEGSAAIAELSLENEPTNRRALVNRYIQEVLQKTGKRITRKDIWKTAGYHSRTEFERWERQDAKRPNSTAHVNFMRVLSEKTHLK